MTDDAPQGPKRETLSASGAAGTHPPRRDEETLELASPRVERALAGESELALRLAMWTAAPVVLLLWLALVVDGGLGVSPPTGDDRTVWTGSLLSLLLLLVALQLVSIQLALEHRVRTSRQVLGLWLVRVTVVSAVVMAVVAAAHGLGDWGTVVLVAEPIELAVLAAAFLARRPTPSVAFPGPTGDPSPPQTQDEHQLLAIGASGGGIRAAAFVLGGHQAVQEQAARLRVEDPAREPHVFAVSGGSYVAAALALNRTYDAGTGQATSEPRPFTESYRQHSPELERLRRHTRYLFEPAWRTKDGLVSLATGAALNLFILGVALRFVTWVGSQFAVTLGLVGLVRSDVDGDGAEEVVDLTFASGWSPWDWLLVTWLPLACLLAVGVLTWVAWRSTAAFDDEAAGAGEAAQHDTAEPRRKAIRRMALAARTRAALVFVAIGWLLVVVGLPGATVGVSALATSNRPVTTAASALEAVGFATPEMCLHAFVERVDEAVARTNDEAAISPGEKRETETGACGLETTVSRTVGADGTTVPADPDAAERFADRSRLPLQVAGIGALLAFVTGLLRRGPSPEAGVATGRAARTKRVLLTYLPLAIVGGLGVYLALRWTFGFVAVSDSSHTVGATVLTAVACALAYLVDANATSMHSFYRSRLSDAFAVGVDPADGRAKELPPSNVYRFSDLAADRCPRLHIVTTLNTLADNEAPSMRGGFPFVFGPQEIEVHREEGRRVHVGTRAYEDFAGPGRVSIMAAVATSGAAISPLMGRYAVQMAPYRALLALFNVRVGTWVRNPMHVRVEPRVEHDRPGFLWMTRKPGLAQVALEAVGRSSADRRWVYLSDGGHLDNTGLVECVRYCVDHGLTAGRVLVLDASNDPVGSWSAVGDALSVVRADLGVDLQRVAVEEPPPWMRRYRNAGLDVVVVKAVRTEAPAETTPNTRDWYSVLPPNVQSFQLVHPDFPRADTARQKFGDLEFEAYRSLGYAATASAIAVGGWLS